MAHLRCARTAATAAVGLGLLLLAWGCADDGLPRRYRVDGEVTYNGKPLLRGTVNFLPQDEKGRGASGAIQDGAYSLTTLTPGDGAVPGAYRVTVTALEQTEESDEILAKTPGAPASYKERYIGPPSGPQRAKAVKAARRLIPDKYNNPDTSGLTAQVKEEPTRVDLHLKD